MSGSVCSLEQEGFPVFWTNNKNADIYLPYGLKWEGLQLCGKFVDLVKVVPVSFGGEILVFEQIRKMRCQVSKFTEEGEVA